MKKLFLLLTFISISGILSAQSLWEKEHRKVFMETCMDGLKDVTTKKIAKNYCACYMQRLEQVYPNPIDADKLTQE